MAGGLTPPTAIFRTPCKEGHASSRAPRSDDCVGLPIRGRFDGRWRSAAPEPATRPDGEVVYLRRTHSIDGRKWSMAFTFSADATGTRQLFSGRNSGAVWIGGYRALDQTYEALFAFDRRRLTPHTPETAEALAAAGCRAAAWAVGVQQDVTETGCPPFRVRARASCVGEYDVVRLTERGCGWGHAPPTVTCALRIAGLSTRGHRCCGESHAKAENFTRELWRERPPARGRRRPRRLRSRR